MNENVQKIAVIGGGNGALAIAADLTLAGFTVNLFEFEEFIENIEQFKESREIKITGDARNGIAKLNMVTTDLEKAINDVDLILPAVPSYAHERAALELVPYLKTGQVIVLTPGSTGGSLVFARVFRENNMNKSILLGEVNSLPYACRRKPDNSGEVNVFLSCHHLYFSAFPAINTDILYAIFKQVYLQIVRFENVFDTGLNNGNPVTHVAPCVLNAGRIEYANGEYYHYQEGITPSVARVIEEVDKERMAVCEALGYRKISTKQRILDLGYHHNSNASLYELYTTSQAFRAKGPANLQSRYLTEDVPYGLVPWFQMGKKLGLKLPVMESLITLASSLLNENFLENGRTLKKMGLENIEVDNLNEFFKYGY